MGRSKFTPGPWSRNIAEGGGSWIEHIDEDYVSHRVAFVYSDDAFEHTVTPRNHADANLIAAAPELYDVCQRMLDALPYVSEYDVPIGLWDDLRSALAKARGENQ